MSETMTGTPAAPPPASPEPARTDWDLVFKESHSQKLGLLVEALAKAQLEFKPILKEAENPAFVRAGKKSKYASLDMVINATRPAMAKHGLVLFQLPKLDFDGKKLILVSKLAHSSGEWIENELVLPAANQQQGFTAHSIGSAITYARRYAWQAITGCVAEEDDDGNAAAEVGSAAAAQSVASQKVSESGPRPTLFYVYHEESRTSELVVSEELKKVVWPDIKKFWDGGVKACMLNDEQLEALKYTMEQRGIPFSRLKEK